MAAGRSFPIRAHLAQPIVGPAAVPVSVVGVRAFGARQAIMPAAQFVRRNAPRPHVVKPIVAPGGPVIATITKITATRVLRRPMVRVKTPPPITGPPATPAPMAPGKIIGQAVASPRRWWRDWDASIGVAKPIVGAPAPTFIASATLKLQPALRLGHFARRNPPKPHLAPAVLTAPAPGFVAPAPKVVSQALLAPRRWWRDWEGTFGVARPVVAPGGPVVPGITAMVQASKRLAHYARRGVPRPHLPSLLPQAPTAPPVASGTIVSQARLRPLVGRTIPHPHVVGPIVGPFVPSIDPFRASIANAYLGFGQTRAPTGADTFPARELHAGGPYVTEASTAPPVAPGRIVSQSTQRPLVGRTVPRPHLAPVNLTPPTPQPPLRPGTFVSVSLLAARRARRGVPRPHVVSPLVGAFVAVSPYRASVTSTYLGFGQIRMPASVNDIASRQLHAGGPYVNEGSALVTPASVAGTATVPTPTVTATATVTPTSVAAVATVPTPTVIVPQPNATVVVATVAAIATIDISAPATVALVATIQAVVTFPALPRIQALRRQGWTKLRGITDSTTPDVLGRDRGPDA